MDGQGSQEVLGLPGTRRQRVPGAGGYVWLETGILHECHWKSKRRERGRPCSDAGTNQGGKRQLFCWMGAEAAHGIWADVPHAAQGPAQNRVDQSRGGVGNGGSGMGKAGYRGGEGGSTWG